METESSPAFSGRRGGFRRNGSRFALPPGLSFVRRPEWQAGIHAMTEGRVASCAVLCAISSEKAAAGD